MHVSDYIFICLLEICYLIIFTTCIIRSNHLGIQFFAEFRNTSAAPLSTRCRKVLNLGSNGRRLDDDTELFNLRVEWGQDSMPNQVDKTLELEQEILLIENNIILWYPNKIDGNTNCQ